MSRKQQMNDGFAKLLKYITVFVFFLLVAVFFAREITCSDIWLHLGAGRYILENLKIPTRDIFSHTVSGKAWIDHEWLFQVIAYLIYSGWGANSLVLMRMSIFTLTFALLFRLGYRKNNYLTIIIVLMPVLILARSRLFVRPEMFTLFFTAFYLFMLHKYRFTKLIYFLVPVQLLWANIHGYFLIGLLIVFSYIAGEAISRFGNSLSAMEERKVLDRGEYRRLVLVGFLLIGTCFINPYTYRGFFYSIRTLFEFARHSEFLTMAISELRRPFEPGLNFAPVLWYRVIAAVSAVLILFNIRRIHIGQAIIYILFFRISVTSSRNMALFGFIAGIATIVSINDIAMHLAGTGIIRRLLRYRRPIEGVICALLIILMSKDVIGLASYDYYVKEADFKNINFGISKILYSDKLVGFAKEHDLEGNVFNNLDAGAYIIGNLYPQCRVFVDGRTELYGVNFLEKYRNIIRQKESLEDVADCHAIRYAILKNSSKISGFFSKLYRNKNWKLIYFDGIDMIFARDIPENRSLIEDCEISPVMPEMNLSQADIDKLRGKRFVPFAYLARSRFYMDIGLYGFAIREIENALLINPDCGECYFALGLVYADKRAYPDAVNAYKEAIKKGYDNGHLRNGLGIAYSQMEAFDWAIKEYKKASRFNRGNSSFVRNLKIVNMRREKYQETLDKLNKEISSAGSNLQKAEANYEAGEVFYSIRCFLSASDKLGRVLDLNPNFPKRVRLYNMLGNSLAQMGAYEKAVDTFESALRINPKDTLTIRNLGYLYFERGEFDKARNLWKKALRIDPTCETTQAYLKQL